MSMKRIFKPVDAVPIVGFVEHVNRNSKLSYDGALEEARSTLFTFCHTMSAMTIGLGAVYGLQQGLEKVFNNLL